MLRVNLSDDEIMNVYASEQAMLSMRNYIDRANKDTSYTNLNVQPGSICWIDYGVAYQYEAGFQHLGLVLSICHGKALVVPMTSNSQTFQKAYSEMYLLPLKRFGKLKKDSALFLNDAKFISLQRFIKVIEQLDSAEALNEIKANYIKLVRGL